MGNQPQILSNFIQAIVQGKKKSAQQIEKERIEKRLNILGIMPK